MVLERDRTAIPSFRLDVDTDDGPVGIDQLVAHQLQLTQGFLEFGQFFPVDLDLEPVIEFIAAEFFRNLETGVFQDRIKMERFAGTVHLFLNIGSGFGNLLRRPFLKIEGHDYLSNRHRRQGSFITFAPHFGHRTPDFRL